MGKVTAIDTILMKAVNASSESIVVTDPNQVGNPIIFANKAFEELTQYDMGEIIGTNCRFLQGEDTDPAAVARIRAAIHFGTECHEKILNYRKDSSQFWNELSISPVHDAKGAIKYFIGIQRSAGLGDISSD